MTVLTKTLLERIIAHSYDDFGMSDDYSRGQHRAQQEIL